MDPLHQLAERKIEEAVREGLFDDLPGRGRPLVLEDLSRVAPELRASWILLKSHGFLPPELEARKEWLRLEDLLAACADPREREVHARGVRQAWLRYRLLLEQSSGSQGWIDYRDELLQRLGR
ncbi:MAG TPA: DnaJ family domain-containing protein [Planctomycetota bacterium]